MIDFITLRLREPSTWAGVSALLLAIGVNVSQEELATVGAGISALAAVILRERGA